MNHLKFRAPQAVSCALFLIAAALGVASAQVQPTPRRFDIGDGIRYHRFNPDYGERILALSPDGARVAYVVEHGDLSRNETVAEIVVHEISRIQNAAAPRVAAERRLEFRSRTNLPPVSILRWSPDGDSLTFLGARQDANPQLFRLSIRTGRLRQLSHADLGVFAYGCGNIRCIYLARTQLDQTPRVPADNALVEHSTIYEYARAGQPFLDQYAIFTTADGRSHRLSNQTWTKIETRLVKFWMSPDERQSIMHVASTEIEPGASWRRYHRPGVDAQTSTTDRPYWMQFLLIDHESRSIGPLVDAPLGAAVGNFSPPVALWSADSRKVFLSNFLTPISHSSEIDPRSLDTSYIVELNLGDRAFRVVQPTPNHADADFAALGYVIEMELGDRSQTLRLIRRGATGRGLETVIDLAGANAAILTRNELAIDNDAATLRGNVRVSVRESANQPPIVQAAFPSGETATLEDFSHDFDGVILQPVRDFAWTDESGHSWLGGLILPAGENQRLPLVVQIYDYDPNRFLPNGTYATAYAAQTLASEGFAVLQMRLRETQATNTPDEGSRVVEGLDAAVDQLAAQHGIDPSRVGLIGFSRGGYGVAYAISHPRRTQFAAAVISDSFDGSYAQYVMMGPDYWSGYELVNGGSPYGENIAGWLERAPGFNAHRIHAAVRLESIGPVLPLGAWEIYGALRGLSRPVELHWLPNGEHVLRTPTDQYYSRQGSVDWMRFWLLGEQRDGAPTQQYPRWRAQRAMICDEIEIDHPLKHLWCIQH